MSSLKPDGDAVRLRTRLGLNFEWEFIHVCSYCVRIIYILRLVAIAIPSILRFQFLRKIRGSRIIITPLSHCHHLNNN